MLLVRKPCLISNNNQANARYFSDTGDACDTGANSQDKQRGARSFYTDTTSTHTVCLKPTYTYLK